MPILALESNTCPRVGVGVAAFTGVVLNLHVTAVLLLLATLVSTVGTCILGLLVSYLRVFTLLPFSLSSPPSAMALRGRFP